MKKYAIGLATAAIFGAGALQHAKANDVVIPYIKTGGNWVSLVGFVAIDAAYAGPGADANGDLHFIFWHKQESGEGLAAGTYNAVADNNAVFGGADRSYDDAPCVEYNRVVRATDLDFTTVDVSESNMLGLTRNVLGLADGDDGGVTGTVPADAADVAPPIGHITDAYLYIENDQNGATENLAAEAVVFDMATGMFYYQYGIDVQDSVVAFAGTATKVVMFQGTDYASTGIYHIAPATANALRAAPNIAATLTVSNGTAYDREEHVKSGTRPVQLVCLALVPVESLFTPGNWNDLRQTGGWFWLTDTQGLSFKGEVYSIGTRPNIFAPLKTYDNSLDGN